MKRLLTVLCLLVALLGLSGCVRYDVGIRFQNQTHGEIIQHIQLGEPITNFNSAIAQTWLKRLERRAKQVGGRIRKPSRQELVVTVPFTNGNDLQAKFEQLFRPDDPDTASPNASLDALPPITSALALHESNLLLAQRNHLIYDLDLRSLGVLSSEGNLLVSPGALIDLHFSLDTPWGARIVGDAQPQTQKRGKRLIWTLKPGEVNHLEAIFWIPSPLGMGTLAIALVTLAGALLNDQLKKAKSAV